jgi:NarL family two-component system response regulator LiaR
MQKINVLFADDHPAFREGLRRLLQEEKDIDVVGQAEDGEEAVNLATQLRPDVAIIDVSMPKLNGIEATRQIKKVCPQTAILILSAYDNDPYVFSAIEVGAAGYLLKNARIREVVAAIRALHDGETVLDVSLASKVFKRLAPTTGKANTKEVSRKLRQRELEVLRLAARGMSNKEIAEALVISVRTVQTHLVNIFHKLEVGSRTEAVLSALRKGWITIEDLP